MQPNLIAVIGAAGAVAFQAQQGHHARQEAAHAMANATQSNGTSAFLPVSVTSNPNRGHSNTDAAFTSNTSNYKSETHPQQQHELGTNGNSAAAQSLGTDDVQNSHGEHSTSDLNDHRQSANPGQGFQAADQEADCGDHSNNDYRDKGVPSHESALEEKQDKSNAPHSWGDALVLQFLHEHSAMSPEDVSKQLQVPDDFRQIVKSEEDSLVLAACRHRNMLSLFRAYAAHDILNFISFARLYCCQLQS